MLTRLCISYPMVRAFNCVLLACLVSSPAFGAEESAAVDPAASSLSGGYSGAQIEELIKSSRHAPKGEFETTAAYLARISPPEGEPLRLARIPAEGTPCGPLISYDADAGILSVNIVNLSGIIPLRCNDNGIVGVSTQGDILATFSRVPMVAAVAEATRSRMSLWLAFRRAPTAQRGAVWRPFPANAAIEGIVAKDIALWITNDAGEVIFKHPFQPAEDFVTGEVPPPPPAQEGSFPGNESGTTMSPPASGPPRLSLAEACKRADRVALVSAMYEARELNDLRSQLQGLQMNGSEQGTTWAQYLARAVERRCNPGTPTQGWTFSIDLKANTFKYPGEIWCSSANKNGSHKYDCDDKYPVRLPPGWQVCRVRYKHHKWRHGRLAVLPIVFEGDPSPPRSRGVIFHITGHGDVGNTSGVRISNIEIDALLESTTVAERRARDCDMLTAPAPVQERPKPRPPKSPEAPVMPAKLSASLINIGTHVATLWLRNTGGTAGRICWRVIARDGDDNQWDEADSGCGELAAGENVTRGLSKMRNKGWKLFTW